MGILTKAAPTLSEDNFIDIMPVAWELMLESDQELAAAAGEYLHRIWPSCLTLSLLAVTCHMLINFTNSLDLDQMERTSVLIWIQTVQHSDSVPERTF